MGIVFGDIAWILVDSFWHFSVVILLELLLWSRGSVDFAIVLLYCLSVISVCDDVKKEEQEQCRSLIKPADF